jgi:hypothetical protein
MKRTFIFMLFSILVATGKIAAQPQYNGDEYNIYFPNNETQLLQYRRPKEWLLGVASGYGSAVQMGYSPLPFLSIEGAYLTALVKDRGSFERKKNAYSFAIGTYWFMENKTTNHNQSKSVAKKELGMGLLISAKAGYSYNKMNTSVSDGNSLPSSAATESDYTALFANLSFGYQHSWGMLTLTGSIQNVEFNRLSFNGTYTDVGKLSDIATQLRQQANYNVFSLGFHNEIGRRNIRVLAGGTFPLIYFQEFKNQAAEIDAPFTYVGVMLHLSRILQFNDSRKHK